MITKRKIFIQAFIFFAAVLLVAAPWPGKVLAGQNDILLGIRYMDQAKNEALGLSALPDDWSQINGTNFSTYFTTSSLSIAANNGDIQIGAIWTAACDPATDPGGCWRQMRIAIDSDGTQGLQPLDYSDPGQPWNMTSGTWDYPAGYPGTPYDNGNNDGTIDFDSGESFPWDNFQWWWYESQYDFTQQWWMQNGTLMLSSWSGRDSQWNVLPNGTYPVNGAVDENEDMQFAASEANSTLSVTIETAYISGTVKDSSGNAIQGARVEAGSQLAWGETRTRADGTFTLSGLEAGASYHLRVQANGKVTAESDVEIPTGQTSADAGTIAMSDAVSIAGTLKLDRDADGVAGEDPDDRFVAFTNQWGWLQNDLPVSIDAWNKQGPGWGNGEARFRDPSHPEFTVGDDLSVQFTINIPPPSGTATYQVNVHVEGYAAVPLEVSVDSSGGSAGTVVLTKASILTGMVELAAAVPQGDWRNIDVQAVDTNDSDNRYWGWGYIFTDTNDPNFPAGQEANVGKIGNFRIDGIPAGTYSLQVRVMGFAMASQQITVTQGQDLDVGTVNLSEGSKITGTLTIQGDTTSLQRWMGDNEDPMHLWIDAWSPSAGWGGTDVAVSRGQNKSASFTVGGLSNGSYEIHCFIGEGYELVDENGNSPVFGDLSSATSVTKNLVLKPFEGIVTGTITGDGVTLDLSKVVVEAKRPWNWLPPKVATVANGGINASTGVYTISGLGTDDYVIKAGAYGGWRDPQGQAHQGIDDYAGDGRLAANLGVGVTMERVSVQNNATTPTTKNITLKQGYSISGTISLSTADAPWHDINDNGKKDTNVDPTQSEVVSMAVDVQGQPVMAMPMEMMFMGGQDPRMGAIQADGTYQIPGLSAGVYIVMPPASSLRIEQLVNEDIQGDYYNGGQQTHHWTTVPQMVVVTGEDATGVNFTFGNGYNISGRLTLPEAQTSQQDWEQWQWVGDLQLQTPQNSFMGHGKPLFKRDFNNSATYDFTFHHVANGDYQVRFWTDRYVPGGAKVTLNGANVTTNLTVEQGANLIGKLIDADTGEAVTSADDIKVHCEATPWVEGSWRETMDDPWSVSYIESDAGLQTGQMGGTQGERENKTPGKFHLSSLPTGHKYVVVVESTSYGQKTQGAKNYVGRVIAGVDIPEGATGDIDVGTIKLKEGTTIKGRLTDPDGNGIPGVDVLARPSDTHDGTAGAQGASDTQGYYTIYGINPDVEYYDLIAAQRPDMFGNWGKKVEWGEKRKYNIPPETTDANFTLQRATATLSGTLTIPEGVRFMSPFKGEGEEFPAANLILQRKGVVYKDMLDGIQSMSMPAPVGTTTTTYTIDNIAPGTYKLLVMNYGLPTQVIDNLTISDGSNTQDVEWNSAGYTISGSCGLATGGYPSSTDISGVVSMNTEDQSLIFGQLTQEADGTYSAYEVPGLENGATYQLVFYKDSGGKEGVPDVIPVGDAFTVEGADIPNNTATITRNAEPFFIAQAVQDPNDSTKVNIGIFSTSYLVDQSVTVVGTEPTEDSTAGELYIKTGGGSLSSVILSGDKRTITATYTKADDDSDVELILAVHYGDDATTKLKTIGFNTNAVASNGDVVNVYLASQVKLGNGDASQIYLPAGALDSSEKVDVAITESEQEPGALALSRSSAATARKMGVFSQAAVTPLPTGVAAVGNQYDFSATSSVSGEPVSIKSGATVTVQIEYDPSVVSELDDLNIWHLVSGTWTKEDTNRTVDTENNTISVEVTSLSPFVAAEGDIAPSSTPTPTPAPGGGGGGGCFISTTTLGSSMAALQDGMAHKALILLALLVIALPILNRRRQVTKKV